MRLVWSSMAPPLDLHNSVTAENTMDDANEAATHLTTLETKHLAFAANTVASRDDMGPMSSEGEAEDCKRSPAHLLKMHLIKFIHDHDDPNTLLIPISGLPRNGWLCSTRHRSTRRPRDTSGFLHESG